MQKILIEFGIDKMFCFDLRHPIVSVSKCDDEVNQNKRFLSSNELAWYAIRTNLGVAVANPTTFQQHRQHRQPPYLPFLLLGVGFWNIRSSFTAETYSKSLGSVRHPITRLIRRNALLCLRQQLKF